MCAGSARAFLRSGELESRALFLPPTYWTQGEGRDRRGREGPGLVARCLILLTSSAQNNPTKKSVNSSSCLEKSPRPSSKIPHLRQDPDQFLFGWLLLCSATVDWGRCLREEMAGERAGKRGCCVCSHPFLILPFLTFSLKKKYHTVRFSLSSLHSSIHIPPLGWWNSAYCVFVLIAGLGTLIRQMSDTGQIKSVVRSFVGSSHYHSQNSFVQESTPSWLVMLQRQKWLSWRDLCWWLWNFYCLVTKASRKGLWVLAFASYKV